jgi:tyrosine-protein phosphatase YwqE
MINLFKSSLRSSGLFAGYTDWHCHLLPGVDDGVQTPEESLQLLALYEQLGIRSVWFTPHIMEEIPNTPQQLRERFREFSDMYHGNVQLHLASENMLDSLFEERLASGDLLPIGNDGKHLLVETSYFNPPYGMSDKLFRIKSHGYTPVLAHPERYVYMQQEEYRELMSMGIKFQLNLTSLVGLYGPTAKHKAEWLLKEGAYALTGTDTHRLSTFAEVIEWKKLGKKPKNNLNFNLSLQLG